MSWEIHNNKIKMEKKIEVKLSEQEIKTILSVMSLVHPEDEIISSVHMIRIIAVAMQRWYKIKVGWTSGYMNRDISYVYIDDVEISFAEILSFLEDNEYIICGRIPHGKLTARGYSLGAESVNFLKK